MYLSDWICSMVFQEETLMKKKQLVSLLVMLAVVVGLAVGYVIVKQNNDKRNEVEEEEEDTTIALYEIEQEDIIRIAYSNESTNLAMVLDEDVWLKEGTNIPMKSENVESMLSTISNLVAIRLIQEDVSDLAEFGLDSPILKYCINTVDGTQYELAIGNKLQTGTDGYYAMLNGVPTVYTVSANYYNPFMNTEREMTLIEDEVTINSEIGRASCRERVLRLV